MQGRRRSCPARRRPAISSRGWPPADRRRAYVRIIWLPGLQTLTPRFARLRQRVGLTQSSSILTELSRPSFRQLMTACHGGNLVYPALCRTPAHGFGLLEFSFPVDAHSMLTL